MKKLFTCVLLLTCFEWTARAQMSLSALESVSAVMDEVASVPLVWKVGDVSEFNVSAGTFGSGKMTKTVTQDTGTAFWVLENMSMPGHQEKLEKLYNKADGQIIKFIRNGTEQNPADSKIDVESQNDDKVTVPAGTFNTLHIVGKTKNTSRIELWSNPDATVIDGTIKLIMKSSFYTITSELTGFKHAP